MALDGVAAPDSAAAPATDRESETDERPDGTTPLGACVRTLKPGTWTDCGTSPIPLLTKKDNPPPYWGYGSTGAVYAWADAAFDGRTMYFTGGGHRFYGGNEIYAFDAYDLRWEVLTEPGRELVRVDKDGDGKTDSCLSTYSDGTPNPRHTYDGIVWANDRIYIFGGVTYCTGPPGGPKVVWTFDPASGRYEQLPEAKPLPQSDVQVKSAFDPATKCIFVATPYSIGCFRSGSWAYSHRLSPRFWEATMEIAPDRRLLVMVGGPEEGVRAWRIEDGGALGRGERLRPPLPKRSSQAGLAYDSKRRVFASWAGDREVVVIDPDDWSVETHANTNGDAPAAPHANNRRVYSKWAYIPDYDVFMGYSNHKQGAWFYRLPDR